MPRRRNLGSPGRILPVKGLQMAGGEARDVQVWQALRAARERPDPRDPATSVGPLDQSREAFLAWVRAAGEPHVVREHPPVRHARHLAASWGMALGDAVRATLFDADGATVLVAVPADRKIDAPRLRVALGVARVAVLRADRGVGRLGWVNLPGDPGALPGLPGPFGAHLFVDPEVLDRDEVVVAFSPTSSVRVGPGAYLAATGGTRLACVGITRLLPEGGSVEDPPRDRA